MAQSKYSLSFTAGSLLYNDTLKLAYLYIDLKDWDLVQQKVLDENILQAKASSSLKRISHELISRVKLLQQDELEFLINATYQEQLYFVWLLICRRYRLIGEFATEVIRERYLIFQNTVDYSDFSIFFNHKAEFSLELNTITESTVGKLRQVLFKMARDAGLLTKDNKILATIMTENLAEQIYKHNPEEFRYFPIFDSTIKGLL